MTDPQMLVGGVAAERIAAIHAREAALFTKARPGTRAALDKGAAPFLGGVPMLWMTDWPQPFPMLVAEAEGA
ncbi:MAG: aspartate aminotransferase family protein, partial [Rubellimicrobium sp.]|nr:aspartate aminotransferase family protein [Rubellimicrobium sp.]